MKQKELADLFSVSVSTIKKWAVEGFPVKGELKIQIHWVRTNRPLAGSAITEARIRKISAEARLKEFEVALREGELLLREEVVSHNITVYQAAKSNFWQLHRLLPTKLAALEPRDMGMVIKLEVR